MASGSKRFEQVQPFLNLVLAQKHILATRPSRFQALLSRVRAIRHWSEVPYVEMKGDYDKQARYCMEYLAQVFGYEIVITGSPDPDEEATGYGFPEYGEFNPYWRSK